MPENATPSRVCPAGILRPYARAWLIEQGASIETSRGVFLIFLPIALFRLHEWADGDLTIECWGQVNGEEQCLGMVSLTPRDNAYEVEASSYWDTIPAQKTPRTRQELEDILQERLGRCELCGVTITLPSSNGDGAYHLYPTGQPRTSDTDAGCSSIEDVLQCLHTRYNFHFEE